MLVHLFGAVSSPSCSNYALRRVATDFQGQYRPEVLKCIENDFYVDDFLKSVTSTSQGITLVKELCELLSRAGFNLTKFMSNSKELLRSIPNDKREECVRDLDFDIDCLPAKRALGVEWSVENDTLEFKVNISDIKASATKRNILSMLSSVYDPLGIAAPFILKANLLLQELCKQKVTWDENVSDERKREWDKWILDLQNLKNVKIKRCYKPSDFGTIVNTQMHHFTDASQYGYGSVSYIRHENDEGAVNISFLIGRSRVAPIKPMTIVKLELAAATTAVRMNTLLLRELSVPVDEIFFWTDSQTVIKYVRNETARHQIFVANRLAIIQDGSTEKQWRDVPTSINPADHASRGLNVNDLVTENWLSAPEFLFQPRSDWPETPEFTESRDKTIDVNYTKISEESKRVIDKLFEYYSDWKCLKRGIAWLIRQRQILRLKSKNKPISDDLKSKILQSSEVSNAENSILRYVQKSEFPEEFDACVNKSNVKLKSALSNLDPTIRNDILCVGGRLRNANIPEDAMHQVILPKSNHVSKLIVLHSHRKVGHQGRNHTLAELRQRYWIIKCGVLVKDLIAKCVICRKLNSHVCQQKMADLPFSRVKSDQSAFSIVGIDYFGNFEIKIGRSIKKRYGVIFSCFSTRAIHIEVADSLDTSSCVGAIRRFIARRGVPKEIFSDNGTNLVSASKELQAGIKELDQSLFNHFAVDYNFKWNFNPPTASHHGGAWERQIRTIRKVLQSVLSEQFVKTCESQEQLHTLLCEVEAIINSRPLTRVSEDPTDLNVITPNSLLLLNPLPSYPPGIFSDRDIYSKRRWRQIQYLAQLFWKRWVKEYLPILQLRQKWLRPHRNIQIGDIVLVVDDSGPRCSWPMGRVIETYPNRNGLVRSVKLRTQTVCLIRPISKLCLLLEQDE